MSGAAPPDGESRRPSRSPFYEARHAPRYERQQLIRNYQDKHGCRLVVLIDRLFPDSVTLFEETLYDADPEQDLHVLLATPGGDGETAIRLVRQAQSRCRELTVIVPDQAKSAGTLFALGAHHIFMGPTSDLGPTDPQFLLPDGSFAPCRAIIAAVDEAEQRIQGNPDAYPLHVSLLSDISALLVQQARSALARANDQLREALACQPDRSAEDVLALEGSLEDRLIGSPRSHEAILSADDALNLGLPVQKADPAASQWQSVWRLWTKYAALGALEAIGDVRIYEGESASHVVAPEAD